MYNDLFMNAMHKINEKAKNRGYINGIAWAKSAAEAGELTREELSNFESCHPLRNLIAHGGAGEISVSKERYDVVLSILTKIEQSRLHNSDEALCEYFDESATPEEIEAWFLQGKEYYKNQQYDEAVKYYSKAASCGHYGAQNNLAICYDHGLGVPKNFEKAVQYYKKSAEQGNVVAQYNLAMCYFYGKTGIAKNWNIAVNMFKETANQGYADSQWNLAECYRWGKGVNKDGKEAFQWYKKAAEQGLARAMDGLGDCYYNGIGVDKNYEQALLWYQKGAEKGSGDSLVGLGNCYRYGHGVYQNYKEAAKYYQQAANNNNMFAMAHLANCFYDGIGVSRNSSVGKDWLVRAENGMKASLQNGSADEFYVYANIIRFGNHNLADSWYMEAARRGHVDAMIWWGDLLMEQSKADGSTEQQAARQWYHKAIEAGSAKAMYHLGKSYSHYFNEPFNQEKSDEQYKWYLRASMRGYWSFEADNNMVIFMEFHMEPSMIEELRKASEQGYATASRLLSLCYQNGYVVNRNGDESHRYLELAANQGDPSSMRIISYYLKDKEKAHKLLLKAAKAGDTQACYEIACSYANGNGVKKSPEKAFEWYKKASNCKDEYVINVNDAVRRNKIKYRANYEVAQCYEYGLGVEKNLSEAFHYYFPSLQADLSDDIKSEIHYKIAHDYYVGGISNVVSPYKAALIHYKAAANFGHQKAKKELIFAYIMSIFNK